MQGRTQQVVGPDQSGHTTTFTVQWTSSSASSASTTHQVGPQQTRHRSCLPTHRTRPAVHQQTLAVYRIFTDLKAAHPGLEIESCSSGGGRVDLGILEVADRIWGSDCVDPVERADIQRYTSLLVPPEMIGEHVGASPAHSTHRATTQELRMAMAFFGHMGIEMEPAQGTAGRYRQARRMGRRIQEASRMVRRRHVVHSDAADPAVRLDGVVMPNQARPPSTVSPSSPPRRPTWPRRYACPASTLTRCMRCRRST